MNERSALAVYEAEPFTPIEPSTTDEQLIEMWLHGNSPNTIRAYRRDLAHFFAFTGKPIGRTYLHEMQQYADSLTGKPATRGRRLSAIKSLLAFAVRLGYIPFNVAAPITSPRKENRLAQRILSEEQVLSMLEAVKDHPRDHAMIRLLYSGGLRVSECVQLRWEDAMDGVLHITGKGGKSRVIRPSEGTYHELMSIRPSWALSTDRVFDMTANNAWYRVRRAGKKAGIEIPVSPHFLRHSHASHAIHNGSDLATIKETLGHSNISTTSAYLHARPGQSSSASLIV